MRHKHLYLRTELAGNRFRANEGASEDANIGGIGSTCGQRGKAGPGNPNPRESR
jgi:hypothetical protein